MQEYTVRGVTVDDREQIRRFIYANFYNNEPINKSINNLPNYEQTINMVTIDSLTNGTSVVAVTTEHNQEIILGCCLNTHNCSSVQKPTDYGNNKSENAKKIIKLVRHVWKNADVWKKTGMTTALEIGRLVVDSSARNRGIARALLSASTKMASERGYHLVISLCTNYYSARILEKLGFESLYELRYDEYLGDDGKPVFCTVEPHTVIKFLTLFCSNSIPIS